MVKDIVKVPLLLMVMVGCAAKNPPEAELSNAKLALAQAEASQAQKYAADLVESAKRKLAHAQELVKKGAYEAAKIEAEEAYVDAKAALARSESLETKQQVEALKKEIRMIKEEFTTIEEVPDETGK